MKKQLLSILLCLIMVVGLLPTAALAEEAAPVFNLATDLAGITIPDDLVTCTCTKTGESKSYGKLPNGFSDTVVEKEGGVWTVIIYVKPDVYMAQFDKDTGSTHNPDINHYTDFTTKIQFKLKYEGSKWVPLGEMPQNKMLHFTCTDKHTAQSPAPTIALVSRTDTDIKVTENNKWEYSKDNGETWQGSCHFTNLQPGTEYIIIARVKETATHQPSANSAPLKISTIGSAITEADLAGIDIPANLVTVKCQTTGDSKAYGRIPGGFDLSNATPYMDNGVLKAIVNLNLPAYRDKYNEDTKKTHEDAGLEGNPHMTFTLKYVNNKWEPGGNFPAVVLLVTCNGSHENQTYTVTFDGNGGVPSVTSMTTIDQKLPELPTATRSGSYSFNGWYTEKNGGTKITMATVFDKDTTVYAHWTYTGFTGSGGGVTTYPITVLNAKNGTVAASHKTAPKGATITLTVAPDKDFVMDGLAVVDGAGAAIKLTDMGNGKYTFIMPASKVTVEGSFKEEFPDFPNPFSDIAPSDFCCDAVMWAVAKDITNGIGNYTFAPNQPCTRAQIVTFLWRAAGSPAPKSASNFTDVPADAYYAKAVAWAVENGITGGTGEVLKRVRSEAANPQGDICWAADEAMLKDYTDCFEEYVSPEDANMMEGYKNTTGYSSPAFCDPTVFIVNTDLAGDIEINGFADLLNPALKGKIAAGDPVNSSSAFQCLIAGLYDMGSGDPMSDAAWDWAAKLVENLDGVALTSSSQVYKGVAEGEYIVGLTWEDPAAAYVRDGVAVKVVFPEEGALMSGQCVSIIKGAPHMENAKKFVDYMLSETCQNYVGQNLTVRPLRQNVQLNDSLTPWSEITRLESYDGVWVAANKSAITEKYSECLENVA